MVKTRNSGQVREKPSPIPKISRTAASSKKAASKSLLLSKESEARKKTIIEMSLKSLEVSLSDLKESRKSLGVSLIDLKGSKKSAIPKLKESPKAKETAPKKKSVTKASPKARKVVSGQLEKSKKEASGQLVKSKKASPTKGAKAQPKKTKPSPKPKPRVSEAKKKSPKKPKQASKEPAKIPSDIPRIKATTRMKATDRSNLRKSILSRTVERAIEDELQKSQISLNKTRASRRLSSIQKNSNNISSRPLKTSTPKVDKTIYKTIETDSVISFEPSVQLENFSFTLESESENSASELSNGLEEQKSLDESVSISQKEVSIISESTEVKESNRSWMRCSIS